MGVFTVSICGVASGLICDRVNAVADSFVNQYQGLDHLLLRWPEILVNIYMLWVSFLFFALAASSLYPYSLFKNVKPIFNSTMLNKGRKKKKNKPFKLKRNKRDVDFPFIFIENFNDGFSEAYLIDQLFPKTSPNYTLSKCIY